MIESIFEFLRIHVIPQAKMDATTYKKASDAVLGMLTAVTSEIAKYPNNYNEICQLIMNLDPTQYPHLQSVTTEQVHMVKIIFCAANELVDSTPMYDKSEVATFHTVATHILSDVNPIYLDNWVQFIQRYDSGRVFEEYAELVGLSKRQLNAFVHNATVYGVHLVNTTKRQHAFLHDCESSSSYYPE